MWAYWWRFKCYRYLVDLYYKQMNISPENVNDENRDRFILSKGHSVEALYCVLADKGFFSKRRFRYLFSIWFKIYWSS